MLSSTKTIKPTAMIMVKSPRRNPFSIVAISAQSSVKHFSTAFQRDIISHKDYASPQPFRIALSSVLLDFIAQRTYITQAPLRIRVLASLL